MVFNTDAHSPRDFLDKETARRILTGAGLDESDISEIFINSEKLVKGES
jgi:histidinol phosphatase-like PHP family hydrolase